MYVTHNDGESADVHEDLLSIGPSSRLRGIGELSSVSCQDGQAALKGTKKTNPGLCLASTHKGS